MIQRIVNWSLVNRLAILAFALLILMVGGRQSASTPVDVFPDLTAPSVTIVTEAEGMTPTDVEQLVSYPIESALNGASGVRRVRSVNGIGISVITVEFDWGFDVYLARQIVSEKLTSISGELPENVSIPTMAPVASIMGEIMFIAMTSSNHNQMELRSYADWTVRRRLLAIAGVAEIIPIGGEVRQYQVVASPERLTATNTTLEDLQEAVSEAGRNASAGFVSANGQEFLIQGLGTVQHINDIGETFIKEHAGQPVLVDDVAEVMLGPAPRRGTGSFNASEAVVLGLQKQPDANTLRLTERIDAVLEETQAMLPNGMQIQTNAFRQSAFINTAIDNLAQALIEGAVLVTAIIAVFLFSGRAIAIVLVVIPMSLIISVLVIQSLGGSVNTMTLGGLVIALGALVDDAIIVVENVIRHFKHQQQLPASERPTVLRTVMTATAEVQGSIVFATFIIVLVFLPLFFLSGVEGRLLEPLGLAYVVALLMSLFVALTLTPVLCFYLLPGSKTISRGEDTRFLSALKNWYRPVLTFCLQRWQVITILAVAALVAAIIVLFNAGRSFLPAFNEGALTVSITTLPGTSLEMSESIGQEVEEILLRHEEVTATTRRTGRAELDPHAQQVFASEIDVMLDNENSDRETLLASLRGQFAGLPGTNVVIGQPLSHRIDHMLSGTRANIAVKLFGESLIELRRLGQEIETLVTAVPGAVDVTMDAQSEIPFVSIEWNRIALVNYELRVNQAAELLETAFNGRVVGDVREGNARYDLVVKLPETFRQDKQNIANTILSLPSGAQVPFSAIADIQYRQGPNTITRENVTRNIVVMVNVAERDLIGVVEDIRTTLSENLVLPEGYYIEYGGQFESLDAASSRLAMLSLVVIAGIFVLLFAAFGRLRDTWLVMLNLPLAMIGGVIGVYLSGNIVTIASIIGFITLFGIATRNGVILVEHMRRLMVEEGLRIQDAVIRGSEERLAPILMTALGTALALVPLAAAAGEPGSEIQAPMAIVILFGLFSSTLLNMLIVPCIFYRFSGDRNQVPE